MEEDVPEQEICCPIRSGRSYVHHEFSKGERQQIAKWMIQEKLTPKVMHLQFPTVKQKNFCKWKNKEMNQELFCTGAGRPDIIDEEGFKKFDSKHDGSVKLPLLKKLFNECCTDTALRKGRIVDGETVVASKSSFEKFHKKCESTPREAQSTTEARFREERDPRNFYTWAVLLYSYCALLPAAFVFNWDATTFSCGNDEVNRQKVYVKVVPNDIRDHPPAVVEGGLGMYIKKYFFHNSAGHVAPPVYVIADQSMEENEFVAFKIMGLSSTNAVGSYGYLVFCKSRAGHDNFYYWYVTTVVLPFIAEVKEHLGPAGCYSDGVPMCAFVSCDGEASQINVLMSRAVVEMFQIARVRLGKTPRSCSAVTQSSDIGNGFKAEKKVMKTAEFQDFANPVLLQLLCEAVSTRVDITPLARKLILTSLLQLIYAAHSVINLKLVVSSYTKFGQQGGNLDFYKILSACRGHISNHQKRLMHAKLPDFVVIMKREHQISEAAMDAAGIINVNKDGMALADDLTVSHKRACLITGDQIVAENERHRIRLDPATIRAANQARQRSAAEDALARARADCVRANAADAKQAKKRADKLDALEKKDALRQRKVSEVAAEKRAMATMTPAEKRQYRVQKAEAALNALPDIAEPRNFAAADAAEEDAMMEV